MRVMLKALLSYSMGESCAVESLVKEVDLAGTTAEGDPCLEVCIAQLSAATAAWVLRTTNCW